MKKSIPSMLLLMVMACGEAEEEWGGSLAVVEGVTRTISPRAPLARPSEVTVTELWSFAGPTEGDVWGLPRHLGVSDRHAFVVDGQADQIHLVTLDGQPAGSIGGPGQGPDEYARPVAAVATDQGTFIVDGGNQRIDLIDDDLTRVGSFGVGTIVFSALPWGPGAIIVEGMAGDGVEWSAWDASGTSEPVELEALSREDVDGSGCYVLGATREHVLRLQCSRLELGVFSRTGELRRDIRVDLPAVVASEDEVEDRVRGLRETLSQTRMPAAFVDQQVEAIRAGDRTKLMNRKVVSAPGIGLIAVWSQNPEDYGSGPATLHLLNDDGVYLTAIEFARPWYDFTMNDGVLYALEREESTGLVTLIARRISLAESLVERAAAIGG